MDKLYRDSQLVHYSAKPVELNLRPSFWLAAILAAAALGASLIILMMPVFWGVKLAGCAMIILATGYYIALYALLRLPWSFVALILNHRGELRLIQKNGVNLTATVLPDSFVAHYLTVLNLRTSGTRRQRNLLILPDSCNSTLFRRLRVWLRWGAAIPESADVDIT